MHKHSLFSTRRNGDTLFHKSTDRQDPPSDYDYNKLILFVNRHSFLECVTEVWGLISLAYPSFSTDCFFGEKSESKTNFNHQGKYI